MSLEPDVWCLPGDLPRHKLRAYGRVSRAPGGAETRRLLNFLSKTASQGERAILDTTPVPRFAQVPSIMNRRMRSAPPPSAPFVKIEPQAPVQAVTDNEDYPPFTITLDESIALPAPPTPATVVNETAQQLIAQNPQEGEDAQFLSHLALLLDEWFDRENAEQGEETVTVTESDEELLAKRRERAYALLNKGKTAAQKSETERFLGKMNDVGAAAAESHAARRHEQLLRKDREARKRELFHTTIPLAGGMRREVFRDGSYVVKDAVGRVIEARAQDGTAMSFTYDCDGKFKSFVRSDLSGKIHTTGLKDRHGVVVRDANGAVRAQGDSMTVDSTGCVSIRKFDGQFWSLDVMRGIHIERRILEDADGGWNSLTALLTSDGFRMVTRFQKLQEEKRESYRRYGDWLASCEASKFRFYGRDGSMIQFDNDEDLEALRPSRVWPAGSRPVEREWVGRRQAGTAWEAVHRYISQYLSAL